MSNLQLDQFNNTYVALDYSKGIIARFEEIALIHPQKAAVYFKGAIFTSGSTGKPKGVSISQTNLLNSSQICIKRCNLSSRDNGSKFAGYGFDASTLEIFPLLLVGGTLHVLDAALKLDPVELNRYFEANNISYSFLPTQFAEKFVANPFATAEEITAAHNGVLYKSGDLARYLADGNIEFLGRNDFQVKIRGYRIELGEIEQHVLAYPGIKDCLLCALSDDSGNSHLCAYYVSAAKLADESISRYLATLLPEYMLPAIYVQLEHFPINSNGKVERKALPRPDLSALLAEYLAPTNLREELICNAYSHVLELERVGVNDNFFNLGGNSIRAIKLVSQLQEHFKLNISDILT